MNLLDHIDKKTLELASGMMRDTLDQRALDFLFKRIDILRAVVSLRQLGKFAVSPREANQLVMLGILQVDDKEYF